MGSITKPQDAQALCIYYGERALDAVLPLSSAVWSLKQRVGLERVKFFRILKIKRKALLSVHICCVLMDYWSAPGSHCPAETSQRLAGVIAGTVLSIHIRAWHLYLI